MSGTKIAEGLVAGLFGFALCVDTCAMLAEHKENKENIIVDAQSETLVIKCKTKEIPLENFKVYTRMENKKLYLYVKGATVSDDMNIKTVSHKYRIKHIAIEDFKDITWKIGNNDKLEISVPVTGYADKISVKRVSRGEII